VVADSGTADDGSARVVVVTGANRGIGLELVRQLATRGDVVVLGSRDPARGQAVAADLPRDRVLVRHLDVVDPATTIAVADELADRFGRLDGLINNAAILYDTWQSAIEADLDVVHDALETNLFGAWRTTQLLLDLLRASARPRIVNVSSEGGSLASMGGGTPAYSVSKAALNVLTRMLAAELRRDRILVNSVCPGWVATDMGGPGGGPVRDGAARVLWALDLPDDGPTGGFFRDGRPVPW
jgi:NAD(P)-dependent dehydrogenase (short-subunit alcohol dehydrogenase family)